MYIYIYNLVVVQPRLEHSQARDFTKLRLDQVNVGDVILIHSELWVNPSEYLDENIVEGLIISITEEKSFFDPIHDQKKFVLLFFDSKLVLGHTSGTFGRLAFVRQRSST
jgi:hypothetical protein